MKSIYTEFIVRVYYTDTAADAPKDYGLMVLTTYLPRSKITVKKVKEEK